MTETLANGHSFESAHQISIQCIPTWQGLDVFQKSLRPCALEESSLSTGKVKKGASSLQTKYYTDRAEMFDLWSKI